MSKGSRRWRYGVAAVFAFGSFDLLPFSGRPSAEALPCLQVGDARLILCANGAFVMERGGKYLMDGGLSYATEDWKRWTQQVRNGREVEGWRKTEDGKTLRMNGYLRENGLVALLAKFDEQAELGTDAARFAFRLWPDSREKPAHVGATFHFPVRIYSGQSIAFEPGFKRVLCPTAVTKKYVSRAPARYVVVASGADAEFVLKSDRVMDWTLVDDREFQQNTYKLISDLPRAWRPIAAEEGVEIAFSLAPRYTAQEAIRQPPDWQWAFREYGSFELCKGGDDVLEAGLCVEGKAGGKKLAVWQPPDGRLPANDRNAERPEGAKADGLADAARLGCFETSVGPIGYAERATCSGSELGVSYTVTWPEGVDVTHVGLGLAVPRAKSEKIVADADGAIVPLQATGPVRWPIRLAGPPEAAWNTAEKTLWGTECHYVTALKALGASERKMRQVTLSFVLQTAERGEQTLTTAEMPPRVAETIP